MGDDLRAKGREALASFVFTDKYAHSVDNYTRRETKQEVVDRLIDMHKNKFKEHTNHVMILEKLEECRKAIMNNEIMPSMRSLQNSPYAIGKNNTRMYNCAFSPVDRVEFFKQLTFVLLSGCGVGSSVIPENISQLPTISKVEKVPTKLFMVPDSIEGWSDSMGFLVEGLFEGYNVDFNYSFVRPEGSIIKGSVGLAPGPEPLKRAHDNLKKLFKRIRETGQDRITSVDATDICCFIADCVRSGGIRRSALICLFDPQDTAMVEFKAPKNFSFDTGTNLHRQQVNVSAMIDSEVSRDHLGGLASIAKEFYDPGILMTNNKFEGRNPCCMTPSTLVHTKSGPRSIASLVGKEVEVLTNGSYVKVDNFRVTNVNQEILDIEMQDGSLISCTPYHDIILEDGSRIPAAQLSVGQKLKLQEMGNTNGNIKTRSAYLKGFLVGDGSCERDTQGNPRNALLWLYDTKTMCADRLIKSALETSTCQNSRADCIQEIMFNRSGSNRYKMTGLSARGSYLVDWGSTFKKSLPEEIFLWDEESKLKFVAGYMDADGTSSDTKNGFMYQISSTEPTNLRQFQSLLKTLGAQSKISKVRNAGTKDFNDGYGEYKVKEMYRLTISQAAAILLSSKVKFSRLKDFSERKTKYNIKSKRNKVQKITKREELEEKVYCCTVPETHSFTLANGIEVGNCEIGLWPYTDKERTRSAIQFCNLTEINLQNIGGELTLMKSRLDLATFLGVIQSSYTTFNYLGKDTEFITARENLLGVSLTGIRDNKDMQLTRDNIALSSPFVKDRAKVYSKLVGVNMPARITTIKPSGSVSKVFGTSSGVHRDFYKNYIQRIVAKKDSAIVEHVTKTIPEAWEANPYDPSGNSGYLLFPIETAHGGKDTVEEQLDLIKFLQKEWINPASSQELCVVPMQHSVSNTVSFRDEDFDTMVDIIHEDREWHSGVSFQAESNPFAYPNSPITPVDLDQGVDDALLSETPYTVDKDKRQEWANTRFLQLKDAFDNRKIDWDKVPSNSPVDMNFGIACSVGACDLD